MLALFGDKMFQSQYVTVGKTRPVILHGYGNAKRTMKEGLTSIAETLQYGLATIGDLFWAHQLMSRSYRRP